MSQYFEYYLLGIIVLPAIILGIIAQAKVTRSYKTFSKVTTRNGQTGSEVARFLLDSAGLQHVKVTKVAGTLTDHYNPKTNVIGLSAGVYNSASVAALGIAAHEVGHAIQYKQNYLPIKLRRLVIPITNLASKLLWPLVFIGILLGFGAQTAGIWGELFVWSGVAVFGLAAITNIITLPVEFNASSRALKVLTKTQLLTKPEAVGAKKVLDAAALTYVAAMLVAVLNLLRFLLFAANRD